MSKEYTFWLDDDLFEKFQIALALTKEGEKEAIERCLKHYIATSFGKIKDAYSTDDWFQKPLKAHEHTVSRQPRLKETKPFRGRLKKEYYVEGNLCDIKEFQAAIVAAARPLQIRYALFYQNGSCDEKIWNTSKISASSNLGVNLNTGILRNWRKKGIVKIKLELDRERQSVV